MKDKTFRNKIKPAFSKLRKDYVVSTIASSVLSFCTTSLFALYNGFLGIYLLSVWHGSICVFYLLLVLIRGTILLAERKAKLSRAANKSEKEQIRYKAFTISGTLLLLLSLALICPIALMVRLEKPVGLSLIPAIATAAYTTYKITMALVHVRRQKRKKHRNILVAELRTINLIDALVSILTLQNTLIMIKSGEEAGNMLVLSAISSAAIYLLIVIITVYLLIVGRKQHTENN
ncbi:MAG: hypothetical protein LUH57_04165 [Ruminococcus sp.]|nr:hypothetical protein [Ruminococcus sp.]